MIVVGIVVVVVIVVGLLEIVVVGLLEIVVEIVVVGVRDTHRTDIWEEGVGGVDYQTAFYYQVRRTQPELE